MTTTKYVDIRREAMSDAKRSAESARKTYRTTTGADGRRNTSIDLNLSDSEQVSLLLAVDAALDKYGVGMIHDKVVRFPEDEFHPDSHIGRLVKLRARLDAALHGRQTWNQDR